LDVTKVKKLLEFDTPTVANGLGLMGVRDDSYGYTGPDIRHLMPEMGRRVGVAVTARMDTTSPGIEEWEPLFDDWLRMMAEAGKGDGGESLPVFAVIESVGPRPRYTVTIGDGMATRMRMAGAEGYLTNGCIRDLEGVREVPLACWAAGLSPMHGQLRWLDIGSTVVIDGMTVKPGDILHADVNGVVTIPADAADQVYDRAAEVAQKEAQLFARLRAPGMTLDKLLSP
jgi:regulator of RNase E activity RraA